MLSIIPYNLYNPIVFGALLGFGVMLGDSVKSFFKRRLDIKPSQPFIPFDQTDSVIGAIVLMSILYIPTFTLVISLILLSLVLHLSIRTIGYYIGFNRERW